MKNYNLENVRKGWKTSLVAGVLVVASVVSVFMEVSTWLEVTPVIVIAVGLLPYRKTEKNE